MAKIHLTLILICFFPLIPSPLNVQSVNLPTIDGIITPGEWNNTEFRIFEMSGGQSMEMNLIYTTTDVYYLVTLEHNKEDDQIILDTSVPHDYFGIEFDTNDDGAIMGTPSNPDDIVLVNYFEPGGIDMYSHSFLVFDDISNDGIENTEGAAGSSDGTLIWEIRKTLSSNDRNGYDIKLEKGDIYHIMLAFWDDKPPRSAAGFVNLQEGNSIFIPMVVGGTDNSIVLRQELVGVVIIISGIVLLVFFTKQGNLLK